MSFKLTYTIADGGFVECGTADQTRFADDPNYSTILISRGDWPPLAPFSGFALWEGSLDSVNTWLATSPESYEIDAALVVERANQDRAGVVAALESAS